MAQQAAKKGFSCSCPKAYSVHPMGYLHTAGPKIGRKPPIINIKSLCMKHVRSFAIGLR
jgi:hypothetical protein